MPALVNGSYEQAEAPALRRTRLFPQALKRYPDTIESENVVVPPSIQGHTGMPAGIINNPEISAILI
jgi:hypothetical protein